MKVPVQLQTPPDQPPKSGVYKAKGTFSVKQVPAWWQSLQRIYQLSAKAVNGNIEFGSPTGGPININGVWATPTTPGAANTDFTVVHNLGRAAVAYVVCAKNAACDVYTSPSVNSSPTTQIILRATGTTVALTLFLF